MVHQQDRGGEDSWSQVDQSGKGGCVGTGWGWAGGWGWGRQNQHAAPLNLWLFQRLSKQRLEVTPTAYTKCISSHYSGLPAAVNTNRLTLAVVSRRMCILSLNPVTKGLFAQINSLLVWYLILWHPKGAWTQAADSPRDAQIPAGFQWEWQAMHHSRPASYCER